MWWSVRGYNASVYSFVASRRATDARLFVLNCFVRCLYDLRRHWVYWSIAWSYPESERDAYRRGVVRRSHSYGVGLNSFKHSNGDGHTDSYTHANNDNNPVQLAGTYCNAHSVGHARTDIGLHTVEYAGTD